MDKYWWAGYSDASRGYAPKFGYGPYKAGYDQGLIERGRL
jgi:hypothetical protein